MVNFPDWVNNPKRQSKQQLAAKRLRYLVIRASNERTFGGTITRFAELIGMDRTTIHFYVKSGAFTPAAAERAEKVFGPQLIQADWLINPLTIEV